MLILIGAPGTGKSHCMAAFIPWAVETFPTVRVWTEKSLLSRVRASIESKIDYLEELSYMIDDDCVFLDDLGSTGSNDFRKEIIYAFSDHRSACKGTTIITTNLSEQEILKSYGDRVHSRLFAKKNLIIDLKNGYNYRQN